MKNPEKTPKGWISRVRRAGGLGLRGLLVVGLGLGAWGLAHRIFTVPTPAPRWTEADLPAIPPLEQNAWREVNAVTVAPLPRELSEALNGPPRARIAAISAQAEAAAAYVTSARLALEGVKTALEKPHFADACPVSPNAAASFALTMDVDSDCRPLRVLSVHRALELDAYTRRSADRAGALRILDRLGRADVDHARTSRSWISQLIATADLTSTLEASTLLAGDDPKVGEDPPAALLAGFVTAARGLDPSAIDARRSVVADYVRQRGVTGVGDEGWSRAIPFDRGRTYAELDRRYGLLYAAAGDPTTTDYPAFPLTKDETFWWGWNPYGKILLDTGNALAPRLLEKSAEAVKKEEAARAAFLAKLG